MSFKALDLVLGLVGIYVFLSLVCIAELIAQYFEKRAYTLLTGLRRLLDDKFEVDYSGIKGTRRWIAE